MAAQSAINSHLRSYVESPYLASLVSFSVGWLLLILAMIFTRTQLSLPLNVFHQPLWIWLGGFCGVFGMTAFILLFPVLGSVQTSLLAVGGQIIMSLLVDQFGWFYSPVHRLNIWRLCGILFLLTGVLLTSFSSKEASTHQNNISGYHFWWQLLAVITGMVMAVQSSINGHLGIILHSSLYAVTISFTISLILLNLLLVSQHISYCNLTGIVTGIHYHWWLLLGGLLGILFSFSSAWLVPVLGTGTVVISSLFGQLTFSVIIDQWGLFGASVKPVSVTKLSGLVVALLGIVLINEN